MHADYARRLDALPVAVLAHRVPTRFGDAQVLECGPPDAPPLLALHGLNISQPRNLSLIASLAAHFRILAPDTPGQTGMSAPARLSWGRCDYGAWVHDVLDGLRIRRCRAQGMSFGAAMLLQAAAMRPDRFEQAALVVPAGLTPVDMAAALLQVALPASLHRLIPSPWLLRRQLSALSPEPREDLMELFTLTATCMAPQRVPPPTVPPSALRGFRAPTLVLAARDDVFFPFAALKARAQAALPDLVDVEVAAERHIPMPAEQHRINQRIADFFTHSPSPAIV